MANRDNQPGMAIFQDVFRRADKNDVGAVSWENFTSFFADGVVGKEELASLFDEMDTHNTNNIDCGELCNYFSKHLGPFMEIYAKVEELNHVVSDALLKTSQVYPANARQDKFVTRFLLREMLNQFCSLQRPLEAASEILDEQAKKERPDIRPLDIDLNEKRNPSAIIPGRLARRAKRQISSQSNNSDASLSSQVERLEGLLDRFENKMNLEGITDEELDIEQEDVVLLVKRTLPVKTGSENEFRNSLTGYMRNLQIQDGCLYVSVRSYKDSGRFVLYEVWTSQDQLHKFSEADSNCQRLCDPDNPYLSSPAETSNITIPANWWRK